MATMLIKKHKAYSHTLRKDDLNIAKVAWENRREDSTRSEEHTSELQSRQYLVCRLLLEKKNKQSPLILILLLILNFFLVVFLAIASTRP